MVIEETNRTSILIRLREFCYFMQTFLCLFYLTELIFRVYSVFVEYIHFREHYKESQLEAIKRAFSFNVVTIILFVIIFGGGILAYRFDNNYRKFVHCRTKTEMLSLFAVILLVDLTGLNSSTLKEINQFREFEYDSGTGMANSYYYGYLNIIGPYHNETRTGIARRMLEYENQNNVSFPVKRLFIIIPQSFWIPSILSEQSNKTLKLEQPLTTLSVDRAGVNQRTYKNSVYSLKHKNRWFVCAEGATPVLMFGESLSGIENKAMYDVMKHEIIIKFYKSLQKLINENKETKDQFELIVYDGDYSDLGDILENKITEILNKLDKQKKMAVA